MTILFLPIDIDLSNLTVFQNSETKTLKEFNPYWTSTPITNHSCPSELIEVLNQLPFDKITVLTHKLQERKVRHHIDVYPEMNFEPGEYEHIRNNEPAGYRLVLKGELDRVDVFNGQRWVTARLPSSPGCYILNSTQALHRVNEDPGREIIYVRGFLNLDRHKELLDRSYAKYKDYAIELL